MKWGFVRNNKKTKGKKKKGGGETCRSGKILRKRKKVD